MSIDSRITEAKGIYGWLEEHINGLTSLQRNRSTASVCRLVRSGDKGCDKFQVLEQAVTKVIVMPAWIGSIHPWIGRRLPCRSDVCDVPAFPAGMTHMSAFDL